MQIYGEAFFFINGWMDFLCLLLAASLGRSRFSIWKTLISAVFGAVYGMMAVLLRQPVLRSVPTLLSVCLIMAFIPFGRRCLHLCPLVMAAGWLLSGLSDFVLKSGADPASVIWIDSGAAMGILLLTNRFHSPSRRRFILWVEYKGRFARLPALRDTCNLLTDHVSGLPVIVIPQYLARAFLPPETRIHDLSTLPPGWHLVRAKTVTGYGSLMCFFPDKMIIRQGRHAWPTEAVIAVSDFTESRALLPDCLFCEINREERYHAVL